MCNRKILSQNKIGYINYCRSNQVYIVEMGNNHLKLNENTFIGFKSAFEESYRKLKGSTKNRVYIETPLEGFAMTFNAWELELCIQLIQLAESELFLIQAKNIINELT